MRVTNPRAAEADRAAVVKEEPKGVSTPAVIRPGTTAPRARGRRSLLLTELLREARQGLIAKATDETKQKLTLTESAQRARAAKARKKCTPQWGVSCDGEARKTRAAEYVDFG